MTWEDLAYDRTKTIRRNLGQQIRNTIGAAGSTWNGPPNAMTALSVARSLDELLKYATRGRLRVAIIDRRPSPEPASGAPVTGSALTPSAAIVLMRGEQERIAP